jgi:hypothetical protein
MGSPRFHPSGRVRLHLPPPRRYSTATIHTLQSGRAARSSRCGAARVGGRSVEWRSGRWGDRSGSEPEYRKDPLIPAGRLRHSGYASILHHAHSERLTYTQQTPHSKYFELSMRTVTVRGAPNHTDRTDGEYDADL